MRVCDHHEHDNSDSAVWHATDRNGFELGDFCADHLGDALDGFDADVHLERIDGDS